jgi:hypothetical protein
MQKKSIMDNDTYVLVSDDEEVVGLFQNSAELGDVLRVNGEWGAPTFEQTEEWDGYEMVTIELRFVDVYDQMMADGEDVNLETIQPYITEQ